MWVMIKELQTEFTTTSLLEFYEFTFDPEVMNLYQLRFGTSN